jgi:hypothetical protein
MRNLADAGPFRYHATHAQLDERPNVKDRPSLAEEARESTIFQLLPEKLHLRSLHPRPSGASGVYRFVIPPQPANRPN